MLTPMTYVISDEGNDPISSLVNFLKDMLNNHYDGKIEEPPDFIEDWKDIQMLCPISDPANNGGRINLPDLKTCLVKIIPVQIA